MSVGRRSVLRSVGATLGAGALGTGRVAADDDEKPDLYDWLLLERNGFEIAYLDGYRPAAETALATYEWAREAVDAEYPHDLSYALRVYVTPSKEIQYREFGSRTRATARTGSDDGRILTLTPDWFGPCGDRGPNIEHPKRNPFVQTAIHEYSHAPFYQHLFAKKKGYTDQPRWLSQGIGDYIARNYRPAYIKNIEDAVESDTWDFEQRPYYWGLFFGEFMYERNSPEDVVALVKSTEPSFEAAVEAEFGTPYDTFIAEFKSHMRSRVEAGIEPQPQAELDECTPDGSGRSTATATPTGGSGDSRGDPATPAATPTPTDSGGATGSGGSAARGSPGVPEMLRLLFRLL